MYGQLNNLALQNQQLNNLQYREKCAAWSVAEILACAFSLGIGCAVAAGQDASDGCNKLMNLGGGVQRNDVIRRQPVMIQLV